MEVQNEQQLNTLLADGLRISFEIGLRGNLVDLAFALKMFRDKNQKDMEQMQVDTKDDDWE